MMLASSVSPPTSVPTRRSSAAGRGALIAYTGVLLYASLSPFFGWSWPSTVTLFTWPRYWTFFDAFANVLAYVPFGLLLAGAVPRTPSLDKVAIDWKRAVYATAIAALFSLAMELLQACLPGRVSSPLDLFTNAAGGLLGALLVIFPASREALRRIEQWRERRFATYRETDWGLLLLILWLFAQLNPSIPFFEAGSIGKMIALADSPTGMHPYDPLFLLPQAIGIGLNVCGFALLVSLLINPHKRVALNVVVVLLIGFVAKISMASFLMKAPVLAGWLTPATAMGCAAGLFAFLFFGEVSYRWRTLVATLFVFAGGVMAKLTSVYRAFEDTLQLFNWPYGHLATFANLTSWVHEIWPLAAFLFLSTVFIRHGWSDDDVN